jgi:hypothetical protein
MTLDGDVNLKDKGVIHRICLQKGLIADIISDRGKSRGGKTIGTIFIRHGQQGLVMGFGYGHIGGR